MDEQGVSQPVPGWFRFAAIASILFMAIGCFGYLASVIIDPATLPLDRRNLMEARPVWMIAVHAIAVWVGLIGTVMLLMRKKVAERLLLVSLIAAVLTFVPYAIVPAVSDLVTANDIGVAVIIILITGAIWNFARNARKRGWLQ